MLGRDDRSGGGDDAWVRSNRSGDGGDRNSAWLSHINRALNITGFDNRSAGGESAPHGMRDADLSGTLHNLIAGLCHQNGFGLRFWDIFDDGAGEGNGLHFICRPWRHNRCWLEHSDLLSGDFDHVSFD